MSGNIATIATMTTNNTANNANANDGTPQVSILASASAKRMQEKRRQSRILKSAKGMGVGKKYPSVGTHHRNTKHTWLFSELAELSAAYKEHRETMPCWAIADMLYYSFGEQVKYNQNKAKAIDHDHDHDHDQPIYQLQEPRTHLPSIQSIQSKLMDCISLFHDDMYGYASQHYTQMHKQVWEHLALAEKHREMLKQSCAKKQDQKPSLSTRKLTRLRHDFLFSTDAEFEATLPPAKRRKVVLFEHENEHEQFPQIKQEQEQEQEQEQTEEHAPQPQQQPQQQQVDELMSLLEDSHLSHQHEREVIQNLVADIRRQNHRIGVLVGNVKDAHEEIEECRETIQRKMEQIESIVNPTPQTPQTPQTQTHEDCCGGDGDCDCWSEDDDAHGGNYYGEHLLDYDSSGWDEQPQRGGDYDHAEECS